MSKISSDLTEQALQGYDGLVNPHIPTSLNHTAHELGNWFRENGRPEPTDVRPGRGDSMRAGGERFGYGGKPLTFTKVG